MKEQRPTFFTKNGNPIRAGGVLFTHKKLGYLMQKVETKDSNYKYTDFGGKTDAVDLDIVDTILRELREETNNELIISRDLLEKKSIKKYLSESKYLIFIIRVKSDFALEIENMGDEEICNKHKRKVVWVKKPTPVHRRLIPVFKKNRN